MRYKLSLLLLLLGMGILFLPNLAKPFNGHHEFNGVFYGQIAKNYLRYGLLETKGGQVDSPGNVPPAQWSYHTHHPATYPLLLAASFKLFGLSEATARVLSIIATVIGFLLLSKLLSSLHIMQNTHLINLVLCALALTPLIRYFGRLPVFEPILLPVIVASLAAYHNKKPIKLFIFLLLAILIDWPGYWPAISLVILELLTTRRLTQNVKVAAAALIAGTGIILAHQWLVTGTPLTDFLNIGLHRLGTVSEPYTLTAWLHTLLSRAKAFYGLPLLAISALGTLIGFKEKRYRPLATLTACIAAAHILVFRNITWYHDYMLYHSIPFIALTITIGTSWLFKKYPSPILHGTYCALLIISTYFLTNPFYTALSSTTPHADCITITTPTAVTAQKRVECPPFITFYADRTIPLTIAP